MWEVVDLGEPGAVQLGAEMREECWQRCLEGAQYKAWLRSFRFILRAAWQLLGDFKQRIDTVPSLFKCHLGRSFVQVDLKRTKQNIGLLGRLFS